MMLIQPSSQTLRRKNLNSVDLNEKLNSCMIHSNNVFRHFLKSLETRPDNALRLSLVFCEKYYQSIPQDNKH